MWWELKSDARSVDGGSMNNGGDETIDARRPGCVMDWMSAAVLIVR
jgi:hypothetical protein